MGLLEIKGPHEVHAQRFNWRSKKQIKRRGQKIEKRKRKYEKEDLFIESIREHKKMSNGEK
jgi:hypothetical protein